MEGPPILILKEAVQPFKGKQVLQTEGNAKIDQRALLQQTVTDFKSWGKHFIICFPAFSVRVHFMMFGTYRINERKQAVPRLSLQFENGEINLYTCAVALLEGSLDDIYDWEADILSDDWNPGKAIKAMKGKEEMMVSDILLDQDIFAGVGNIIKNEALFRARIHPETRISQLKPAQRKSLANTAREYSFDFYRWRKIDELKKRWQAYTKKKCPRCSTPIEKKYTGRTKRRSFFCPNCQVLPSL